MAARKATVAQAMGKIDELADSVGKLAEIVLARESAATDERAETRSEAATVTRTVKLPDLTKHMDRKRGMGVDGTYTENVAIFRLREDGQPVAKRDGSLKKPTRVRVEDVEYLLDHADDARQLCEFIRAEQASKQEAATAAE